MDDRAFVKATTGKRRTSRRGRWECGGMLPPFSTKWPYGCVVGVYAVKRTPAAPASGAGPRYGTDVGDAPCGRIELALGPRRTWKSGHHKTFDPLGVPTRQFRRFRRRLATQAASNHAEVWMAAEPGVSQSGDRRDLQGHVGPCPSLLNVRTYRTGGVCRGLFDVGVPLSGPSRWWRIGYRQGWESMTPNWITVSFAFTGVSELIARDRPDDAVMGCKGARDCESIGR